MYIVVKGETIAIGTANSDSRYRKLTFENNAPFKSCISKINNTFVDKAENLDIVIPMHNMLKYSDSYSMASESLWNYYRDEVNVAAN